MTIPKNINRTHIIEAINRIHIEGVPENREATKYELAFNNTTYPPKYVISLANKYANGDTLLSSEFSGGEEANDFLKSRGFLVQEKKQNQNSSASGNLEIQFHRDMLNIYENARKIGYNASRFIKMVANQGGLNVAKKFINSNNPSDGFTKLVLLKRWDLTVEALVLKNKYHSLFSNKERQIVKNRLIAHGYDLAINNESYTILPELEPVNRDREYNSYDTELRSKIVYEYLFKARTHRWLDENIIDLNPIESRGYQAMGILHHIGLKDKHKGIFKNISISEAINLLNKQQKGFTLVIEHLRYIEKDKALDNIVTNDIESELSEEEHFYTDGTVKEYFGKRYERKPENRKKAIALHGLHCFVCDFNFEKTYGERGKDFIEVHHVNPLSTIKEKVVINPVTDLVPVCSNCHRMIHRKKDEVLSIEELKKILNLK
jgi:5-methylcytosine-specific restriction protein A